VSSAPTALVRPLAPVNVSPPSIEGDLTEGRMLTAVHGSWSNTPTSYGFQWEDCVPASQACTPIPGATGPQHVLSASDVGSAIAVLEGALNAGGRSGLVSSPVSSPVAAAGTGGAPIISIVPVIQGQPAYGQTLTASFGAWQGKPTLAYSFQWQDCKGVACSNITAATANTYLVTTSIAAGDLIEVTVTATNAQGGSLATSAAAGPIAPLPAPPPIIHIPPGGPPPV
jgi:hypothetical protein